MTGATSEPLSREDCAKNARRVLEDEAIREKLADLFAFYFAEATDVMHWAASENEGVHQEGLENEIFSCFHHIARGFCSGNPDSAVSEIDKGRKTHLKRLLFDAFKIVIANHLEDYNATIRTLDYIVLNEDYKTFNEKGFQDCLDAQRLAREIKHLFKKAKDLEAQGQDESENLYRETLNKCSELEEKLITFKDDAAFKVCIARFNRGEHDRKSLVEENRKWRKRTFLVSLAAIAVSVAGVIASWLGA